jgi:RNA recognition motif. (a.k.a. RRM, RBD, or RNP domain)/Zinc knuckle
MGGIFDDANEEDGEEDNKEQDMPEPKRSRTTSDDSKEDSKMDESEDEEDLFAPTSTSSSLPSNNTRRRAGLSKFVRRILDPHRQPTGLIQPPQVIPLNDEFLQAFGHREKQMDQQIGRTIDIDNNLQEDSDKEEETEATQNNDIDNGAGSESKRKLKITNLKYTTTADALEEECLHFGKVVSVNMIMDDHDSSRNCGRAYVIFETAEAAQAAIDIPFTLDGRPIRITLAEEAPKRTINDAESRYFVKDMATKCFRCGKVGHREAECPNPPQMPICPICANIHLVAGEPHELWTCPLNRVCFNCGIPGHINRECREPRGSCPPRLICSACCGSGHIRQQCQRIVNPNNIPGVQEAICLVCGQKGHFQCTPLRWFFGLKGVFCYNCGGRGHVGHVCQRSRLDDLVRNDARAMKEIERAEEYKMSVSPFVFVLCMHV